MRAVVANGEHYIHVDEVRPLVELAQKLHSDRTEGARRSGRLLDFRMDATLALRDSAGWRALHMPLEES